MPGSDTWRQLASPYYPPGFLLYLPCLQIFHFFQSFCTPQKNLLTLARESCKLTLSLNNENYFYTVKIGV
jgi:hypothetical protein